VYGAAKEVPALCTQAAAAAEAEEATGSSRSSRQLQDCCDSTLLALLNTRVDAAATHMLQMLGYHKMIILHSALVDNIQQGLLSSLIGPTGVHSGHGF
jgi:hypothetical protein